MGRIMVIARKGAPPSQQDDSQDTGQDGDDSTDSAPDGSQDVATCPNCGCQFDDESGDVVKPGAKVEGGGDYGKGDATGKGPDLALPPTTPDAQAPAGDGALAALLGPLLAAGR